MLKALLTFSILLSACGSCPKCPKPVPPAPVTVIAEPLECNLPDLPMPLSGPVGFPSPDGQSIYMSITDASALIGYIGGLHNWIIAAAPCLTGKQ